MPDTIYVSGNVLLNPSELNENWKSTLVDHIKKKYINCTKQHGYITKIVSISNKITSQINSDTCYIKFNVNFIAEHILPAPGKTLECTVNMLFGHGIFAEISDKIKILIPIASLKDYKFDNKNHSFIPIDKKSTKQPISKGDKVKIEISEIKYEKNRYNCIGNLK